MDEEKVRSVISVMHHTRFLCLPPHYPSLVSWNEGPAAAGQLLKGADKELPLGVYVNVPFCASKCSFCYLDVTVLTPERRAQAVSKFTEGIALEARLLSGYFRGRPACSVYLAGGTVNLLTGEELAGVIAAVKDNFGLTKGAQISMEANPDFFDGKKISELAAAGVNMVTVGVQTLDQGVLDRTNRHQNAGGVPGMVRALRRRGIKNIGIDLICVLPGQSAEGFLKDVAAVAALRPAQVHLNRYKPVRGRLPEDERRRNVEAQDRGFGLLARRGYIRIDEDSAVLDKRVFNVQGDPKFQMFSNVIGLGPGAMTRVFGRARYQNRSGLDAYLADLRRGRLPVMRWAKLGKGDELTHYVMTALLDLRPVRPAWLEKRFGRAGLGRILKELERLAAEGIVLKKGKEYRAARDAAGFCGHPYEITRRLYEEKYLSAAIGRYAL